MWSISTLLRYFAIFVLTLGHLVCNVYSRHISIWTGLISSPQWPHMANGYWPGQHSPRGSSDLLFSVAPSISPLRCSLYLLSPFKNPSFPSGPERTLWLLRSPPQATVLPSALHQYLISNQVDIGASFLLLSSATIFFIIYCFILMEKLPN